MDALSSGSVKDEKAATTEKSEGSTAATGHASARAGAASMAAGRSAVNRILGDRDTVAQVDLCVWVSSADPANLTWDDLKNERLGHSFLNLRPVHGAQEIVAEATKAEGLGSFGFHPATENVSSNPLHSFSPGIVASDEGYGCNAYMTFDLTHAQMTKLLAYKQAHAHANYSPYFYNCTTFAEETIRASGHTAPDLGSVVENVLPARVQAGAGLLSVLLPGIGAGAASTLNSIAMPNSLYKSINALKKMGNKHANIGSAPEAEGFAQPTQEAAVAQPAQVAVAAPPAALDTANALAEINPILGAANAQDGLPGLARRLCAMPLAELATKLTKASLDAVAKIAVAFIYAPAGDWEATGRLYLALTEDDRRVVNQVAMMDGYINLTSITRHDDLRFIARSVLPSMTPEERNLVTYRLSPAAQKELATLQAEPGAA